MLLSVEDLGLPERRRPPAARRHLLRHPPRRGARHRRRRGQRPGRAGRVDHGHAPRGHRHRRARRQATSPPSRPASAARPASATSPRTGTATGCCSTPRCGRTGSSATRPGRRSARGRLIDRAAARKDTERIIEEYDVRTPGPDVLGPGALRRQPAEADRRPRDERRPDPADRRAPDPRRRRRRPGRDLGPHQDARRNGLAVLLISADLDELIGLSDPIEVILRGRLVGTFDPDDVTPEQLGSAMTGAGEEHDDRAPDAAACSALARAGPGARGGVRDHQPGADRRRRPGRRGVGPDPAVARAPQRRPTSSTTPRCSTSPASRWRSASG